MKTLTILFALALLPALIMSQNTVVPQEIDNLKNDVKALQKKDKNIVWKFNQFTKQDKQELEELKKQILFFEDQSKYLKDSIQSINMQAAKAAVKITQMESKTRAMKNMFLIGFIVILVVVVVVMGILWLKLLAKRRHIKELEEKILNEFISLKAGFENQLSHLKAEIDAKIEIFKK